MTKEEELALHVLTIEYISAVSKQVPSTTPIMMIGSVATALKKVGCRSADVIQGLAGNLIDISGSPEKAIAEVHACVAVLRELEGHS